ncbi:hypothetical protein PG987_016591 [Apiospora arundinis]
MNTDRSDSSANLVRDPSGRPPYIGPAGAWPSSPACAIRRHAVQVCSSELSSEPHPEHLTAASFADPATIIRRSHQRES